MKAILASAALATALATLATAAFAQPKPGKAPPPPPPPPPPQAGPPPIAGALFPCRSEKEVCYVGVVKDGKLLVLFTNDPKTEEITAKPLTVAGADLAPSEGRLVMLTGSYDPKAGLSNAELADTASPLTAFAIKAALGGGGDDGEEPAAPPAPPPPSGKKR